jgi:hypothetical protein
MRFAANTDFEKGVVKLKKLETAFKAGTATQNTWSPI